SRATVRVEVRAGCFAAERLDHPRGGAERALVGRQPDQVLDTEVFRNGLERLSRVVGRDLVQYGAPEPSHRGSIVTGASRHGEIRGKFAPCLTISGSRL